MSAVYAFVVAVFVYRDMKLTEILKTKELTFQQLLNRPIGDLDLLQRLVEEPLLRAVGPWPRQLVFVEDAELHAQVPPIGQHTGPQVHRHKGESLPLCERR